LIVRGSRREQDGRQHAAVHFFDGHAVQLVGRGVESLGVGHAHAAIRQRIAHHLIAQDAGTAGLDLGA
jgi:hypothetical protein